MENIFEFLYQSGANGMDEYSIPIAIKYEKSPFAQFKSLSGSDSEGLDEKLKKYFS